MAQTDSAAVDDPITRTSEVHIRNFRYSDLDAVLRIAEVSFADEMIAQGATPQAFIQQMRKMTAGRMLPFTIISALAGVRWEVFVAEINGNVVGCGLYSGRKHMYLSTLMVDPAYRRQGIGQALLVRRIQRIAERGFPFVTASVLSTNQASLGNLNKQQFEVGDRYSIYEHPLPLPVEEDVLSQKIAGRAIRAEDKPMFISLERKTTNPVVLRITDPTIPIYFPSTWSRIVERRSNALLWRQCFEQNGTPIAFLAAGSSRIHTKGFIVRPVVQDEHIAFLPHMLGEATSWLTQIGKTAVQLFLPDDRAQIAEYLQDHGWTKVSSWLYLVKWLDEAARVRLMSDLT